LEDSSEFLGDFSHFLGDFWQFLGDLREFLGDFGEFLGDFTQFLRDLREFLGDFTHYLGDLSEFSMGAGDLLRDFTHLSRHWVEFLRDFILPSGEKIELLGEPDGSAGPVGEYRREPRQGVFAIFSSSLLRGRLRMLRVQLKEAEPDLGRLLDEAASGEDVIIEGAHGTAVRLVPVPATPNGTEDEDDLGQPIGHALDRYIGTWSAEQEAEVLQAVELFDALGYSPNVSHTFHQSEKPGNRAQ
jgi:antitoxin (DNA-binding transcriptional repressor) of toxin-antitoxin stability system